MNEEKKHIIYTAEDIKRYITGDMPAPEMHAMEMAALDDPFLAEAMEGYDLMEQKDWSNELLALKTKLNTNQKDETPIIAIGQAPATKWWKKAAAVLILGATAATAYIFTNKTNKEASQPIASIETSATDSSATASTDSIKINTAPVFADSSAQLLAKVDNINSRGYSLNTTTQSVLGEISFDKTSANASADSNFIYKPSPQQEYLAMKDEKKNVEAAYEKEVRNDDVAVVTGNNNATASNTNIASNEDVFKSRKESNGIFNNTNAERENSNTNDFFGQVVTPDNKPLSYANISIPQQGKPVYTDAAGKFRITARDTTLTVNVTSAGYNSQRAKLKTTNTQNVITMQPQNIAVAKVGAAKQETGKAKRQTEIIDSSSLDEPAGGWVQYNTYLNDNLRLPEEAKEKNIHGEVEMTVKLKENGEVSTVKIDKPLCSECDAEAVRLVKEGPKWETKKNRKKSKIKVTVKF